MLETDDQLSFKIVLVGDANVGKTNLLSRYITGQFEPTQATIGVAYHTNLIQIEGKSVRLELWDTGGEDRFQSIIPAYYKSAQGAVLVYDISNANSFVSLTKWLEELTKFAPPNIAISLAANKVDLRNDQAVSMESAEKFAADNQLDFVEVSALDGTNVNSLFDGLAERILQQRKVNDQDHTPIQETTEVAGDHCCMCCSLT